MKRKFWRKTLSVCLALLMVAALVPAQLIASVGAATGVTYLSRSWDGSQVVTETKTVDCVDYNYTITDLDGWYYVNGNHEVSQRLNVTGTANIVIQDGSTLLAKDGIHVPAGKTLNVYNTSGGENGTLECRVDTNNAAAIGGNDGEDCGTVNIYSGTVIANTRDYGGEDAAGIGGGYGGYGGYIYIYGGKINATGGSSSYDGGAGIGGGGKSWGGFIKIYGGDVTAQGGANAAGIGGGDEGMSGDIEIFGGTVKATGGSVNSDGGAGIGGGNEKGVNNIVIYGGNVTAQGGCDGAGIGGGDAGDGGNITIVGNTTVDATGGKYGAGIGGGQGKGGGTIKINGAAVTVTAQGGDYGAGIGGGENGSGSKIELTDANVTATGGDNAAGIGGGDGGEADSITITGGTIHANGGSKYSDGGAGIGGGNGKQGGIITITDSDVTAQGGCDGAGIGGGDDGVGGVITITGGTVNATGGANGAGIGGGDDCGNGGSITINSGTVIATGGENGAGIGSGDGGSGGTIRIKDGGVTATGGKDGAGIGGGDGSYANGSGGDIEISGGTVNATGGKYHDEIEGTHYNDGAAGIGGGYKGNGGIIKITGGEVTATGGFQAAGIGGGDGGSSGSITITGGKVRAKTLAYYVSWENRTGAAAGIGDGMSAGGDPERSITISGGDIFAETAELSKYNLYGGAGIGSGYKGDGSENMKIIITGGKVEANGAPCSAGIGGGKGNYVGEISISGDADIIARGNSLAAAIGGGHEAKSGKITISGGKIEAIGGYSGAGIGSGSACTENKDAVDITINGGNIIADGGGRFIDLYTTNTYGSSIGAGGCLLDTRNGGDSVEDKSYFAGNIYLNGGTITANRTIGTTREEALDGVQGEVYFNGATVQIETDENNPSVRATTPFFKDEPDLHQKVSYKNSGSDPFTDVAKDDRITTLKDNTKKIVLVSHCEHKDMEYRLDSYNSGTHLEICPHCNYGEYKEHTYGEPEWYLAENHSSATATFTCEKCNYKETVDATVTCVNYFAKNVYTVSVRFNGKDYQKVYEERFKPSTVSYKTAKYTPGETDPADGTVTYDDAAVTEYTEVTAAENTWSNGTYVVLHDTVVSEKITVTGNVNLILCDDTALTAENGITVSNGGHLNIYAQKNGTGKLIANGTPGPDKTGNTDGFSAIEGSVTVHGGVIEAIGGKGGEGLGQDNWKNGNNGGKGGSGFSGDIVIYGGSVKAVGGNGGKGGIGKTSGKTGDGGSGLNGNIEIYGGSLDLSGGAGTKDGAAVTATSAKIWGNPTFVTDPFTEVAYKAPTITENGNIHYYAATNGDSYFCENRIYTPADEDVVIPKIVLKHYAAKAPSCTENGNSEYWYSEYYKKYYSDANAENEIAAESFVIPATGHSYGEPTWSWADDYSTATATSVCSKCDEPHDFAAAVTSEKAGIKVVYTATVEIDGTTYTATAEADLPREYVAQVDPTIDENGAYILGTKEHYVIDGKNYAVNDDKSVGEMLSDLSLSYFDFSPIGDHAYQINYYTGPAIEGQLVIPKTYEGKPITVLGSESQDALFGTNKAQFELVLNENIRMISRYTFNDLWVTKVTGDTSNLCDLGSYAFSWANNQGDNTLDIKLDFPGLIRADDMAFDHMKVTARVKHAMSFANQILGAQSIDYIITDDQHPYGDPVWNWTDDCHSATATFTCTDNRCKHEETVDATIEKTSVDSKTGMATYTATAEIGGRRYTDTKTGYADDLGARLLGYTLSLNGDIGINFYMELSDTVTSSSTAKMHFTIPKNGTPDTKDIMVSDATQGKVGDKTYYIFKCQVAAKEMTSEIKAQIIDGNHQGTEFTYSVKEYADYLLAHTDENAEYKAAESLVKAMLNYGAYSQIHFDKTSTGLANEGFTDQEKALDDVEIDIADAIINNLPGDTTYEGATLSLKSETSLSLYFKSSSTLSFSCGRYTVEYVKNGDYQVARIRGIKAKDIGDVFTLNVSGVTVKYSPLNYCKNKLGDDTAADNLKDALKALYWYYKAADAYFGSIHTHTAGEAVRENEVAPTCTAEGSYDEVVYCTTCGDELSRATKTIDRIPHTLQAVAGTPATVKETGTVEHYECSVCHKLFMDAEGNNETTAEALVIPKLDPIIDLAAVTDDIVVQDGQTVTGKLNGNYKISVADGAAVTLRDANITCLTTGADYAGITLVGDATIILEGSNTVMGGLAPNHSNYSGDHPGIFVPKDNTMVIDGEGSLYASPGGDEDNRFGCGIGGGYQTVSGNISIENGNITAIGGSGAAGIGSASGGECGCIWIDGGTVTAIGGDDAAGIGSGYAGKCEYVEIWLTVTKVTATKGKTSDGDGAQNPIGSGDKGECEEVYIEESLVQTETGDTIVITPKPGEHIVNLSALTGDYEAQAGDVLTGTLSGNKKITVADGATISLRYAYISSLEDDYGTADYAGITLLGDATILLGPNNYVKGGYEDYPGIYVPENKTLTIDGTGSLEAYSNGYGCGIGGGWEINSGNIEIKGGTINAKTNSSAAAIGGGFGASCGNITITGGDVTAKTGYNSAGIGSGEEGTCGNITITGGTIVANGGELGAGIGSGAEGTCGDITITNTVTQLTARKGADAPYSVGAGADGSCGTVTIDGVEGMIAKTPFFFPVHVPETIDLSQATGDIEVLDGDVLTGKLSGNRRITIAEGAVITLKDADITCLSADQGVAEYAGITLVGDATINLEGTNVVKGGYKYYPGILVPYDTTLTISGDGSLDASANGYASGIGGGFNRSGGNIVINGGTITARGSDSAAGIGGSFRTQCCNITINGGTVTAIGGNGAAGIGSGDIADCGNITITGGTVDATGGSGAAGIGPGANGNCGDITITDTVTRVTATKGNYADNCIGKGIGGSCGTVTIGGKVGAVSKQSYTYQPE